ncbi:MAG: DEAD/DEAH box helicase [Nitrospirota bacterium]
MSFSQLGLAPELERAVERAGYKTPTPIQEQAIPVALKGGDVLGCAQTGTGKTAGFALPLLQRLGHRRGISPRALILAPTRELALQIGESVRALGAFLPLRSVVIFGGVGYEPQDQALRRGVDIVIATPGRLLDHLQRKTVRFDSLEVLVLDEADRMLDMGFIHDIKRLVAILPKKRQTMMFSATMPPAIRALADDLLVSPTMIAVAPPATTVTDVVQIGHPVDHHRKRALLVHLLGDASMQRTIVFTRTKHGANNLAEHLTRHGHSATALHSNKSQSARVRALADFREGRARVLVATDLASRGIDVPEVSHVVNFDVPNTYEAYVHRIGRTARAGASGCAISLVSEADRGLWRDMQREARTPVATRVVEGFEPGQISESVSSRRPAQAPRGAWRPGRGGPGVRGSRQPLRRPA